MDYLPIQEFSEKWDISKRRIQILCRKGRIEGARMIGNMWVIPRNVERPHDARMKNPISEPDNASLGIRRELKRLLKDMFKTCSEAGIRDDNQKEYVLTAIGGGLCSYYLGKIKYEEDIYRAIYKDISGNDSFFTIKLELIHLVADYIWKYKEDSGIDDILSWAYQYANKIVKNNVYSQTQFFTEKYMIQYLVNHISGICQAKKIVDPCVGGGNFLVECLERMCQDLGERITQEDVLQNVDRLFGYDIDQRITGITVVNIRLRVLAILKRRGFCVTFDIWDNIMPHIFKAKDVDEVEGSLAIDNKQIVDVLTGESRGINEVLGNADIVLTNPPFATIKGMQQEQKDFLKKYYPNANCDTCVSFLEAIYKMLHTNGICGIVSQNSWMHLKSFKIVREKLTSCYAIYQIVNLGSGAFLDLSGEKSNVSLLIMGKDYKEENQIEVLDLSTDSFKDKVEKIERGKGGSKFAQSEINGPNGYDFTEKGTFKSIYSSEGLYKDIGIPMQGTSTGNAEELVGYFWEHFGDREWISVSNGGGYCRWQGLNDSVVRWGRDGEYIKAQNGSAMRNVKYFPETELVFSDTGTAGLNVRILLKNQIFIASGPGIRVIKGNKYTHLALLNSRLAAYYVRMISPKLTVSAGYIGQIPVRESIYSSVVLEKDAKFCVELKQRMLSARPNNLEYDSSFLEKLPDNLEKAAWSLFNDDITNELLKLEIESRMDSYILEKYGFSEKDKLLLEENIGKCAYLINGAKEIDITKLDKYIDGLLDTACCLRRTRTSKNALGSDGIIEFVSKDLRISPEMIGRKIQGNPDAMKYVLRRYKKLILHNAVLSCLGYNTKNGVRATNCRVSDISEFLKDKFGADFDYAGWIRDDFNIVHKEIFKGVPYLLYKDGEVAVNGNRIVGKSSMLYNKI